MVVVEVSMLASVRPIAWRNVSDPDSTGVTKFAFTYGRIVNIGRKRHKKKKKKGERKPQLRLPRCSLQIY